MFEGRQLSHEQIYTSQSTYTNCTVASIRPRLPFSFVWLLMSLSLVTCQSEAVDPMPKETQSGQDIIACRIDGDLWKPYKNFNWDFKSGGTGRIARYSTKSKTLFVGGVNQKEGRSIDFSLINCAGEGTYALTNQCNDIVRPTVNCGAFSPSAYISGDTYWTDAQATGEVVITKLTDRIVAGRFFFVATNPKTGKTVKVTDGRFDFFYAKGVDD